MASFGFCFASFPFDTSLKMASASSEPQIKTRIKINSPNINVLEFGNDNPLPALWEGRTWFGRSWRWEKGHCPMIVVVTGIIEEYADAGRTIDALVVYLTLLVSNCAPNVYTYSVVIKALAADPDPKFLEVAKERKAGGGQAVSGGNGKLRALWLDKMDVIEVLKGGLQERLVKAFTTFCLIDSEYSDSDDDYVAKIVLQIDLGVLPS
ncbi:hypothetical protein M0R45_028710 [Rubus argutus]|uniref:Uncharacterized protein n=1 Tax=Rubus argutus TaxID=59490 RepID=A0AAW1W5G6_RUBAR